MQAFHYFPGLILLLLLSPAVWVQAIAFVDVTVVPIDQERLLPPRIVLIQDGRITGLGPSSRIKSSCPKRYNGLRAAAST
jgi:putative transposon-encoded protein